MKIVADDKIPFLKGVFEPRAEVVYLPGDQISATDLKTADALITRSITKCNRGLLDGTAVKYIATATIGDDHIDKEYCKANKILWTSAKGCNASAVEQYVTAALLGLAQKNKINLADKTIGVIGVGNIGSRVARVAELMGMNVLLNDPPRARLEELSSFSSLKQVFETADIVTFHVPLISEGRNKTFHLADSNFFNKQNKNCIFINTSRGEVVDGSALKQALKSSKVSHAILDVWENEPELDVELLGLVEIATPHIAGYSLRGKANGTSMVVLSVSNFFGLGLESWYPELTEEIKIIKLDCDKLNLQQVMQEIFTQVYAIENDVKILKAQSENFESLRRNYTLRRENSSFYLELHNCQKQIQEKLKSLGFTISNQKIEI